MITKVAQNGPKVWGYARVNGVNTSFWGAGQTYHTATPPEAQSQVLWKQKTTNSKGYREITVDQLRTALPGLPEEFYE